MSELQKEISQMIPEKVAYLNKLADEIMRIKDDHRSHIGKNDDAMKYAQDLIALKYGISFAEREKIFALIGSILGNRPRKKRVKKVVAEFTLLRKGVDIVEFISTDGVTFEYVMKSKNNAILLSCMGAHHPSPEQIKEAQNFAQNHFKIK